MAFFRSITDTRAKSSSVVPVSSIYDLVLSAYAEGRLNPIINIQTGARVSAINPGGIFSVPKARPTSYRPFAISK